MDVTSATSTPTTTTPPPAAKPTDYDTFLRMMTVQIKNQDPLNPMSADDFAVQLATFSGVEQQTKTNDLLAKQLAQNSQDSMAQMVGWVGKEARIAAPVNLEGGGPVTLSPNPALDAEKVELVVTNAAGTEVARTEIPVSTKDYSWAALDSNGNALPDGVYNLTLESFNGETLLGETPVEYYGTIHEVRSASSGVTVLLDGGVEVSTALITALREPA